MSTRFRYPLLALFSIATSLALAAPATAGGPGDTAGVTYSGAFEFQGLANDETGATCRGEGAFGVMKPGARVTISERDAAGEFSTIAKGRVRKGRGATAVGGDAVCRMPFKAKARTAPAGDSTIYLEVKGVTFNIRFPAAEVVDGDLRTWTCEFSDTTCALVVGAD